ncbi:GD20096 [Drosophila simulans]|uniref:GD20096 n=1 Tax=Drosophila simulans TaxID=7240 RepID=B4QST4_DROSI|nr:GD20096 [Drosophila simulans]
MSQTCQGTETLTIEALDFIYENEMEYLHLKQAPKKEEQAKAVKIKRLTCNINGCTYSTDRRRDLRRHRRSQKHMLLESYSDSESEVESSLFSCNVCGYKTAKRYCFDRHKESRRHIMKEQEECEKLMDEAERAEQPVKRVKKVEEPSPSDAEETRYAKDILHTCTPCDYSTTRKSQLKMQAKSQAQIEVVQSQLMPNEYIQYLPHDQEQMVELSLESGETEDEYLAYKKECSSTMECKPCEYRTARRFCFARHMRSERHLAKVQAELDGLEETEALEPVDYLEAENELEEIDHREERTVVEVLDMHAMEESDIVEDIQFLEEPNGLEEIDNLVEIDGVVQIEPGFEVIEYTTAEENVYEEIVYLTTEDSPEDISYLEYSYFLDNE